MRRQISISKCFCNFLYFRYSAVQVFGFSGNSCSVFRWLVSNVFRDSYGFIFKTLNFREDPLNLKYETSKLSRKFRHQSSLFLRWSLIRSNSSVHN